MTDKLKPKLMLHVSSKDFVEDLIDALGIRDDFRIEIVTPTFDRTDGRVVTYYPRTVEEFNALHNMTDHGLKAIGCGQWDEKTWLYPFEWYWNIPNGYIVHDINDTDKAFKPGVTCDDKRMGFLAYGFKRKS